MAKISLIATVGTVLLASMTSATVLNDALNINRAQAELQNFNLQADVNYFDSTHVKYYMACARGGLGGFIQGFYANESETVSKDCLGESTFEKLDQFIKMLESGNLMDVFKSFGKMYQFTYDLQKQCRSNEISFEVVGYCLNKTNDCKIETLIANF